jgi:hypothetical protein
MVVESGESDPENVVLTATSPPMKTFTIRTPSVDEPFVVRVVSQFDPKGIPVNLRVIPTLFLSLDRADIQGFGLETVRVSVSALGIASPKGKRVQLEADPSGHFENASLTLDENGRAQTTLRSDGTGPATITVSAPGNVIASKSMNFETPWRTILACLIGGLVGGFIRLASSHVRGTGWKGGILTLLVSICVGAVVFGLSVVGVNVFAINFTVEVGSVIIFVLSALGAFVGDKALRMAAPA